MWIDFRNNSSQKDRFPAWHQWLCYHSHTSREIRLLQPEENGRRLLQEHSARKNRIEWKIQEDDLLAGTHCRKQRHWGVRSHQGTERSFFNHPDVFFLLGVSESTMIDLYLYSPMPHHTMFKFCLLLFRWAVASSSFILSAIIPSNSPASNSFICRGCFISTTYSSGSYPW